MECREVFTGHMAKTTEQPLGGLQPASLQVFSYHIRASVWLCQETTIERHDSIATLF